MRTVIVHNDLRDAIYRAVDKALEEAPQFREEREAIYSDLLDYYDEHGVIPDFTLQPAGGRRADPESMEETDG